MGKRLLYILLVLIIGLAVYTLPTHADGFISDAGITIREEPRSIVLPWWIIVIIISGNALVVWWFLPPNYIKNRKKSKKVQKRY